MKTSTTSTLIIMLALIALVGGGCNKAGNTNSNVQIANTSPAVRVATPTPTPREPEPTEFVEASLRDDISYQLAGVEPATSKKMTLEIRNKTERIWEVKIEAGTKLEPSDEHVQRMVLTKELHVHLEPHEHKSLEIDVNCLDIGRETPSRSDSQWTVARSPKLTEFIKCANEGVDRMKQEDANSSQVLEKARFGLIQRAIWNARGATREDWIHFLQRYDKEYRDKSDEEAGAAIDKQLPWLEEITKDCQSLATL